MTFTRQFVADRVGVWKVRAHVPGFKVELNGHRVKMKYRGDVEDLRMTFTRTTAPLKEFATGFVTLRGPTRVRIPVALRPVSVAAPRVVNGSGTTGSVDVPLTAGFTGDLTVDPTGLAKADTAQDTVATGDSNFYCVTVPAGARVLRVDLDSADDTADLDLFAYRLAGDCTSNAVAVAGQSATASADESFTLLDPQAASYVIEVNGFAAPQGQTTSDYTLDVFVVDDSTHLGDFKAVPNPVPVTSGQQTTFQAQWSGLDPGARYLGVLDYEGSLGPTVVHVDTATP